MSCLWSDALATQCMRCEILVSPFLCFPFGNIPVLKALITFCLPLRGIITFLRASAFFAFLTDSYGFEDSLKISISSFSLICSSSASSSDKSLL